MRAARGIMRSSKRKRAYMRVRARGAASRHYAAAMLLYIFAIAPLLI